MHKQLIWFLYPTKSFKGIVKKSYKFLLYFIYVVFCINFVSCQEKPSYQDDFQERILIQYLLAPPISPEEECPPYFQKKSECLSQTSGWNLSLDNGTTILPPLPEVLAGIFYLSVTGESPVSTNLEGICGEIIQNALRTRFTKRAMGCYFNCLANTWKNLKETNNCNQEASNLFTPELEREKSFSCIQSCSAVNNTSTFF